ncbi:MAG: glycosyltransferase family A protein [Verrucomicrobiota bacterium]
MLTIAIPTWNRAGFLRMALESVISQCEGQGLEGFVEVVVANNGSTDETEEVVREYAERRVLEVRHIRHDENIGMVKNILFCFEAAKGRFVAFLGDDDVVVRGGIAAAVRRMREHPEAAGLIFQGEPLCDRLPSRGEEAVEVEVAAEKVFYDSGNFGRLAVNVDWATKVLAGCGEDHEWTVWPQTEIMFHAAAICGQARPFLLTSDLFGRSPNHEANTKWSAYRVWFVNIYGLLQPALNLREVSVSLYQAARGHLLRREYLEWNLKMCLRFRASTHTVEEDREFRRITRRTLGFKDKSVFPLMLFGYLLARIPRPVLRGAWLLKHGRERGGSDHEEGKRVYGAEDW